MASISIDVSAIVREVRSLVTEIKNERTAEKEKAKAAQMLVYRSLSLHPALDRMHPPTGMLADVDWYTELRFSFTSGIFRKLGQNEHFRRMALLGDTGTRARIMMLLLWIIGHRLAEDSVAKLLSTAMGDAIRRDGNLDLEAELVSLDSVKRVLTSLQKMIKTKIPLPPDRNPFQGRDYNITDEDLALPRSELWGYELPEEQQYEYNIRRNPVLLLRPLSGKIIIPETKLTMLIIQWAACNFGLGKKVYSAQDIDHEAFWNADPPLSTNQDDDGDDDHISDWSSSSSKDSFAFEAHAGVGDPPYESMWEDEPMEDWVHSRFCSAYGVHAWAHQSFVRVLLFNSFSASQTLPTSSHISKAVHVANQLSCRLPMDILQYAEQFIVARSLLVWRETYADKPWKPEFRVLPPEERGLLVIFVDALRWDEAQSWIDVEHPSVFGDVREFLMNPLRYCQDSPDILALPRLASQYTPSGINVLPELDSDICICGECPAISSQLPASLESFRHQYFSITSFRPQDCNALARTWEPMISAAEEWLEDLVSRVECQFTLFHVVARP
ncbi:hypothetical protein BT96DRAFT_986537 [Gymnopus androsaceus JB14]|uniref:Uncharacterized protein n=1 Tax=Gymnopus androsaceus JB14 TaxID=1447944 RepID=A0A6A4IFG9_9AGAR|nr:hypothetical protein BT96DRAFT_986537 [Gymnopus androsaceus JB14]